MACEHLPGDIPGAIMYSYHTTEDPLARVRGQLEAEYGKRCLANGSTEPPRRRWRRCRTRGSATSSRCSPGARRGLGCAAAPPEANWGFLPGR